MKVSIKHYLNTRLKEVNYHGVMTYPLYIQIVFNRNNSLFKSYYFHLFSKPKYAFILDREIHAPKISEIKELETKLINDIIDKLGEKFTLKNFRDAYEVYGRDLCDAMEVSFQEYLFQFFQDEGMWDFASTVREGIRYRNSYAVIRDFKKALKPDLYKRLVENSLRLSIPYLPLLQFVATIKKWPFYSLNVMEWISGNTQEEFEIYLRKYYPEKDIEGIINEVHNYAALKTS